jgi:hypothetical protein
MSVKERIGLIEGVTRYDIVDAVLSVSQCSLAQCLLKENCKHTMPTESVIVYM